MGYLVLKFAAKRTVFLECRQIAGMGFASFNGRAVHTQRSGIISEIFLNFGCFKERCTFNLYKVIEDITAFWHV